MLFSCFNDNAPAAAKSALWGWQFKIGPSMTASEVTWFRKNKKLTPNQVNSGVACEPNFKSLSWQSSVCIPIDNVNRKVFTQRENYERLLADSEDRLAKVQLFVLCNSLCRHHFNRNGIVRIIITSSLPQSHGEYRMSWAQHVEKHEVEGAVKKFALIFPSADHLGCLLGSAQWLRGPGTDNIHKQVQNIPAGVCQWNIQTDDKLKSLSLFSC